MQPGEKRTLTLLMPGLTGVQPVTAILEAEQHETTAMLEDSQTLLKIKQELRATGLTVQGYCWMDPHGELVKSSVTDLQQETYRTTRARALAPATGHGFDLGFDTIVRVTSPLPRPWETTQVVYEATLQQRNPAETFASDASQRVESLDERRARITVRAMRPQQPADIPAQTPPTDDDRHANSLIQSDDERVRQLAGTIAADVTDPWQIAVALEKWVRDGIQKKNFSQGFATAADVARVARRRLYRTRRAVGGLVPRPPDSRARLYRPGLLLGRPGVRVSHVERSVDRRSLDSPRCHPGTRRHRCRPPEAAALQPLVRTGRRGRPQRAAGHEPTPVADPGRAVEAMLGFSASPG